MESATLVDRHQQVRPASTHTKANTIYYLKAASITSYATKVLMRRQRYEMLYETTTARAPVLPRHLCHT
jgi:hypothetical protein